MMTSQPEPPTVGISRIVDDLLVTLTAIPNTARTVPRAARRRATAQLAPWIERSRASTDEARPTRLESPALTVDASIRATVSLEPGPAGVGYDSTSHWHLAMSVDDGGARGPAPESEIAAWIGLGWPMLAGAALDTYVMTALPTARHAHLPASVPLRLAG